MVESTCSPQGSSKVRCSLCGREYERAACTHQGCPLAAQCRVLACPYCGYRSVDTEASTAARWLRRLLGPGKEGKP